MSSHDPEFLISNGNMNMHNNYTGSSTQVNLIISGLAFILAFVAIIIAVVAITGKGTAQVNVTGVANGGSSGK